jgi:hypothetical protein
MSACPGEIAIAIHYWTTPGEYSADNTAHRESPFARDVHESFVKRGLLRKLDEPNAYGATYASTEALGVYIDALCSVPFPVQQWVIPSQTSGERMQEGK